MRSRFHLNFFHLPEKEIIKVLIICFSRFYVGDVYLISYQMLSLLKKHNSIINTNTNYRTLEMKLITNVVQTREKNERTQTQSRS